MKDSPLVSASRIVLAIITSDHFMHEVLFFGSVVGYNLTVILSDFLNN
jgi:hypothetical protein